MRGRGRVAAGKRIAGPDTAHLGHLACRHARSRQGACGRERRPCAAWQERGGRKHQQSGKGHRQVMLQPCPAKSRTVP